MEKDSAEARAVRYDFRNNLHQLLAPNIFPGEICHGLTKAERQKVIPQFQSRILVADILSTPPDLFPSEALLARALEISMATRSGFYDCLYVALAERESCELLTADVRVINNLQATFSFITSLAFLALKRAGADHRAHPPPVEAVLGTRQATDDR